MDRLSFLLERFPPRAGVFHVGPLSGTHEFHPDTQPCHLHVVRRGHVRLGTTGPLDHDLAAPGIFFLPRAESHRLLAGDGTEVISATLRFGAGGSDALIGCLPHLVAARTEQVPALTVLADLISIEHIDLHPGRQSVLDRLCELAAVGVLRHCMATGLTNGGTLAGMCDARLSKALVAILEKPEADWALAELAALAGMSRARFALQFHRVVGMTPGDKITACRIAVALELLRQGLSIKQISLRVGYASATAFAHAFMRTTGVAPAQWRAHRSTLQP
jgi:transcriptional regulator GlxA family with amidase domain